MNNHKSVNEVAYVLYKCFLYYNNKFHKITKGAKDRFEQKKWLAQRKSVNERSAIHEKTIAKVLKSFSREDVSSYDLEFLLKVLFVFKAKLKTYPNPEIPYSFCISVIRRLHPIDLPFTLWEGSITGLGNYTKDPHIKYLIKGTNLEKDFLYVVNDLKFKSASDLLFKSALKTAEILEQKIPTISNRNGISYYKELFYRNHHAYMLGIIHFEDSNIPFAWAFANEEAGIGIDGLLVGTDEIAPIFSFSRNYLQVNASSTATLIEFIKKIIPNKHIAQLYINLGFQEHGKELLLLEIYHSLKGQNQFDENPDTSPESLFISFTHPVLDYELKLIRRDKESITVMSREELIEKHQEVISLDRIGRLPDRQYFNKLLFPLKSFPPNLANILLSISHHSYSMGQDWIELNDIFIERKVTPVLHALERSKDPVETHEILTDFGLCLKELALSGIFVHEMNIHDFGISKDRKVILHTFHKIKNISSFTFTSKKSQADKELGQMTIVSDNLIDQLFSKGPYYKIMHQINKDITKPRFWNAMKKRNKSNVALDIKPYQSNVSI